MNNVNDTAGSEHRWTIVGPGTPYRSRGKTPIQHQNYNFTEIAEYFGCRSTAELTTYLYREIYKFEEKLEHSVVACKFDAEAKAGADSDSSL